MAEKRPLQPKRTTKSGGGAGRAKAKSPEPPARPAKSTREPVIEPPRGKRRSKKWLRSLGPRARAYAERQDVPPPPTADSETADKVEYIANELAHGRWDGYVSRAALSKAWGVGDARIQQIATEAHRLVAYDKDERERKRLQLAVTLGIQRELAAAKVNRVTGLPDFAAVARLAELEAKFVGITFEDDARPDEVAMRIVVEDAKDEAVASDGAA